MSLPRPPKDRSPITLGVLDVGTFPLSVQLAPRVEALGYTRYWISEHHGEGSIPSPALLTPVIAGLTRTMRVGTAGILLRFQSPLAVAEGFRMLGRLFPGRIDLGLARSPTLPAHATALRDGRPADYSELDHAAKVADVQGLLRGRLPAEHPLADQSIDPPLSASGPPELWVDSTSPEGAGLAARLGCCYAFHDHYGHARGREAVERYVREFQPSPELARPSWNVTVVGHCAADDADAERVRGQVSGKLPPGRHTIIGTAQEWSEELARLVETYGTRGIVVQTTGGRYDLEEQTRSFARIADAARSV